MGMTRRQFAASGGLALASVCAMGLAGCGGKDVAEASLVGTGDELAASVESAVKSGFRLPGDSTAYEAPKGASVDVSENHTNDTDYWVVVTVDLADEDNAKLALSDGVKLATALSMAIAENPSVEKLVYNCRADGTQCYQVVFTRPSWPQYVGTIKSCLEQASSYSMEGWFYKLVASDGIAQSK